MYDNNIQNRGILSGRGLGMPPGPRSSAGRYGGETIAAALVCRVARRIAHAHTSSRFSRRGACGGGGVGGGGRRARDPWLRVLLGGQSPLTHAGRARRTPGGPPHRNNHAREIPRIVRDKTISVFCVIAQ